jgi:hypothetical protein
MRWEELEADLLSQADAESRAELAGEVADRTRREIGRLRLVDRLRPALGAQVIVRSHGAGALTGTVADVGADWLLVAEPDGRAALVPLTAVMALTGVGGRSYVPESEGEVERRFDLRFALRALVRDRAKVSITFVDGTSVTGTLDRVAADHVDLAQHEPDQARRAASVRQVLLVPLAALSVVRRLA